jgi:hypothetical protein
MSLKSFGLQLAVPCASPFDDGRGLGEPSPRRNGSAIITTEPNEKPTAIAIVFAMPLASAIGGISSNAIALNKMPAAKC